MITGRVTRVTGATELAHYQTLLTPWIDAEMGRVVRIRPEIVTGCRLVRKPVSGVPNA